uniref:ABC transporter permease n=1 Tax=Ignisphaera aggregans TaxID=334771 RepID=A0A7C5Z0B6_9CREN
MSFITIKKLKFIEPSIKKAFKNRIFLTGFSLYMILVIACIIGSMITPRSLTIVGAVEPMLPPSNKHPLGTDILGRDILAQLYISTINSSKIGLIAALIGTFVGSFIGFVSGYYGKSLDFSLRILIDVFLSVPSLLFLVLISALVRVVTIEMMALLIAAFSWPWPARQVRAQVLSLKEREFVYLAKLSGEGGPEIIIRELMPHLIPWMIANFVNAYLVAILTEAGLSILGLGPQMDITLGIMLWWALSHAAIFRGLWWWWTPPIILLIYSFFTLYLIQIGLTEIINPRAKVM